MDELAWGWAIARSTIVHLMIAQPRIVPATIIPATFVQTTMAWQAHRPISVTKVPASVQAVLEARRANSSNASRAIWRMPLGFLQHYGGDELDARSFVIFKSDRTVAKAFGVPYDLKNLPVRKNQAGRQHHDPPPAPGDA